MPTVLPEEISRHECVDCRKEVADDIAANGKRHPRKCVDRDGPKRCVTHARKFDLQQRKRARARQTERDYNISAEDSHELYLFQQGRCWLCQRATGATKSLAHDHDHATDEMRGRLCGPCNQFIGRLGDDPEAAQRLVAYLTGDTPYRRLKARQTISAAMPPAAYHPGSEIVIMCLADHGGELYADWYIQVPDQQATSWNSTLVRLADGTWTTERPVADSEPRVETLGECGSCHALPDQPHTEYCKRLDARHKGPR